MSGTYEDHRRLLNYVRVLEKKAVLTAERIATGDDAATERLVDLELGFYIWERYYHWIATTGFDYSVLEERIEALKHSRFIHPESLMNAPCPPHDAPRDAMYATALWNRNDPPPALPTPTELESFERELGYVREQAHTVINAIEQRDQAAIKRLCDLEVAFYLWRWYLNDIQPTSVSPRWKQLQAVVKRLRKKR